MDSNYVINIGRQLGSGGREIGEKLAKRLGISFYDNELITLASEASGLSREHFEHADEKASPGLFNRLFGLHGGFPYISEASMSSSNCLSNDSLFDVESAVIRRLAREQSCVIVGRCADYILRNHPRAINVFISSSEELRAKRLSEIHHISEEEAKEMMHKADKNRADFYNYYSTKEWGAAATYHLCVDSSVLGIDATVDFVETFIKQRLNRD